MNNEINELLASLSPEEYEATMRILSEVSDNGTSNTLTELYNADYEEIPVDIDTFIESDEYAGWFTNNGRGIYPYWRERLREIFDGNDNYSEISFTGSIGSGKSHIAVLALGYALYQLMCLKDPYKYFGLAKGSNIYIVFFNTTLTLSQGVAYTKFQSLLQNSPWFMRHGRVSGTKYIEYTPNGPIAFSTGSQMEHSIGKDIFLGLLDEINFVKGADVQMEKSKMMKLYSSVLERIRSRFTIYGKVRGKLFLVSSKKSEYDFLEQYIKKQMGKPGVYVADAVLFRVKPSGTYCGKMFKVAVGGSNMPSKIVQDGEDPQAYERQGYDVMDVPIEFKSTFELDMETSLMNILGVSVSNVTKFLTYDIISKCYREGVNNPFRSNVLSVGMRDTLEIQDFLDFNNIPIELLSKPIFIHLDASVTGDRTGLSAVAAVGYRYQNKFDIITSNTVNTKELLYRHIFSVAVQCPANSEISFQKTRNFIYYLKHTLHWNIKGISTDGFQSVDTRQLLITMGFDDVSLISLDRTPNGYLAFKSAVVEDRIVLLDIPELETELIRLERNNISGKVDHPVDGCFSGDTELYIVSDSKIATKSNPISVTFEELYNNYDKYKNCNVVSYNLDTGCTELTPYKRPVITKYVTELIELELESGDIIKCTPNHRFLLKSGEYKEAKDLTEDDDIVEPFVSDWDDSYEYLKSKGFSDSKIASLIKSRLKLDYINGSALWNLVGKYSLTKTSLNALLSSMNCKRTNSEAQILAGSLGRHNSQSDKGRDISRQIANRHLVPRASEFGKRGISKLHAYNKTEAGRKKLRDGSLRKWRDPEYVKKMSMKANPNYGNHQYYTSSITGKTYYLKSDAEARYAKLLDSLGFEWEYESIRISFTYNDEDRIYVPDFTFSDELGIRYVVEVKHKDKPTDSEFLLSKYLAAMNWCESNGYIYCWVNSWDTKSGNWKGVSYEDKI